MNSIVYHTSKEFSKTTQHSYIWVTITKIKTVLLNPLKDPGLDLYVKDKVAHRIKCIKLLHELSDVTGPTVR